jgi:hypothetical protein
MTQVALVWIKAAKFLARVRPRHDVKLPFLQCVPVSGSLDVSKSGTSPGRDSSPARLHQRVHQTATTPNPLKISVFLYAEGAREFF